MKKRIVIFSFLTILIIVAISAIVDGVQELGSFKNMDVNLKVADFTVTKSNYNTLNYHYDDENVDYQFYVSQDVFHLREDRKNQLFNFFNSFNNVQDKFYLSIASNINKANIAGSTSNIDFDGIDVDNFHVSTSTGDINVSNSKGSILDFQTSTGNKNLFKINFNQIFLRSSTGDLTAKNVYGNTLNSETSTGNYYLDYIYTDKANFVSTTGDYNLENLNINNLSIKSSTGRVGISKASGKNLEIETSTGDNKILSSSFDRIKTKTSTGKIYIESTYAKSIDIKTSTGDTVIYSQNYSNDIHIEASSADITIYNLDFDEYKVEVHTGSGKIRTSFGDFDRDFIRGNASKTIYIKTSSGDVVFK